MAVLSRKKNPADLPSRGIRASEFCSDTFFNWIKRLTFICKDVSYWPVDSSDSHLPQVVQIINENVMKNQSNYGIQHLMDISRYNDYLKLLDIAAYVQSQNKNLKNRVGTFSPSTN